MSVPNQNQLNSTLPFTPIPNSILDSWAKQYNLAELRVLIFLAIKLWRWHKTMDRISLSQFEEGTGLTRSNVIIAIKSLCKKGVIRKLKIGEKGKEEVYYQLVLPEESNNSYQNCKNTSQPVLQQYPQKKEEIHISPIVPTGDTISPSKKEELKEVASRVSVTESQHQDLLKRADGNETLVQSWYDFFSVWKVSKLIQGYRADYKQIVNWVIKAVEKKMNRKKHREESELKKKQEEDRQFQVQQEAIRAAKEKQRLEQEKAFREKVEANRPIIEKYIEKYPGIVRISGMIWNGICEIVDKAHQIHAVFFTQDDFEAQIRSQLMKNGYLCT